MAVLGLSAAGAQGLPVQATPIAAAGSGPVVPAPTLLLKRDTPVHLMVINEVSTKERGVGYRFKLRVNQPVMSDGVVAIPVGTVAWGEVTSAESSGNVGKTGALSAKLVEIDLNGTAIPLVGEKKAQGKDSTGETVMAVWALGPLGLFTKGNNAKIKAGELMVGFTTADAVIMRPGAPATTPAASGSAPASPPAAPPQ
jgi:hypothetical protein